MLLVNLPVIIEVVFEQQISFSLLKYLSKYIINGIAVINVLSFSKIPNEVNSWGLPSWLCAIPK